MTFTKALVALFSENLNVRRRIWSRDKFLTFSPKGEILIYNKRGPKVWKPKDPSKLLSSKDWELA